VIEPLVGKKVCWFPNNALFCDQEVQGGGILKPLGLLDFQKRNPICACKLQSKPVIPTANEQLRVGTVTLQPILCARHWIRVDGSLVQNPWKGLFLKHSPHSLTWRVAYHLVTQKPRLFADGGGRKKIYRHPCVSKNLQHSRILLPRANIWL